MTTHGKTKPKYLDPTATVDERARDLLGRMTLEEKVRQMSMVMSSKVLKNGKFSLPHANRVLSQKGIGALFEPWLDPAASARAVTKIQKHLLNKTRLGIPAMIISECLHGYMAPGATMFPAVIGLASTWNPELVKEIASVAALEASAVGVRQALSPDLDLGRDPRWGRIEETYGEDPHLCSQFAVAYIKGLQGKGPAIDSNHVVATAKHFAAHGSPAAGLNMAPVAVGMRELRSLYLPPFKAAVTEAGVLSIMPAYHEIDGIPCSKSKLLLTNILREEWGFEGYVFSDFQAIKMLAVFQRTAGNFQEAGRQALEAGMDMEAPETKGFGKNLLELVKKDQVAIETIDRAVLRILRVKFLAGLFENPYPDPKRAATLTNCQKHRRLARKAACESIVLLKNKDGLLPLRRNLRSIAVIGPNADAIQLGGYSYYKENGVTPLQGIRNAISRKTQIHHAAGCGIFELSKAGFAEAVKAAEESEVAVVFVGGASRMNFGAKGRPIDEQDSSKRPTCGEESDRADLNLPGVQQQLVEAVMATGTPTVVVLINGRPLSILWIAENVPALLEAWYPGEQGGNAVADILFGKVNPSGKLPVSIPRCVGQVPVFYNHKPSARGYYHRPGVPGKPGRDYVFTSPKPLFEFGYGLSYTTFKYSNLRVSPSTIGPAGQVRVSVDVRNSGSREGQEVVQLYINDLVSSVTTPVKVLRGFEKISLKPNQSKTVNFVLTPSDLALLDEHMEWVVEPGVFEVMVGPLKRRFRSASKG